LFLISAQGNISESIRRGFLALDEEMLKDDLMKDELAGTTAVITVLKGSKIYCVSFGGFFYFNFLIIVVMKLALAHKFF
jgi:protein phosphatase 2C family protein 2/3